MRNRLLFLGVLTSFALLATAWAESVAGKWVGKAGDAEITFVFTVAGTKLTGTLNNSSLPGDIPINDGKIDGNEISFYVVRTINENEMKILWKGKASGDEIRFTREAAGQGQGGGATEIVAKRAK